MVASEFSIATSDNLQLFTHEWKPGPAARAVVVLIHGLGEHGGRYEHVAAALNAAGMAVIAPDLRGHGRTPGVRGHIPSFEVARSDINGVLQVAAGRFPGLPLFLYGHSLGGLLVLYLLLTSRPRLNGAVVTSPGLAPAVPVNGLKIALGRALYRLAPTITMNNGLELEGLSRDPEVLKRVKADPYYHAQVSARLGLDIIDQGAWIQKQTGPTPVPLLILQGSADRLVDPAATRNFAAALTGPVTFQEFPGAYHELHNEPEQAQVFHTIISWLEQRLPA